MNSKPLPEALISSGSRGIPGVWRAESVATGPGSYNFQEQVDKDMFSEPSTNWTAEIEANLLSGKL